MRLHDIPREAFLAIMLLLASSASFSQGATRYWYFGTMAMMEFTPQGVRVGAWPDSSEVAPGVFYSSKGEGLFFTTANGCFDLFGRPLAQGGRPLARIPWQPYNLPHSIMFFLPGRADTIHSVQSYLNPSENSSRGDFKNGTLGLSKIDPEGNNGNGAIQYATDAIVPAYINNKATELQVAACQILVPHSNGKDLWLVVPMVSLGTRKSPCETWVFPVSSTGIDTSKKIKSPTSFRRMFVPFPVRDAPNDFTGEVKSNTDISRIAYVGGNRGRVAVFDFDASTGSLSNELEFSDSTYWKDSASALDTTGRDPYKRYSISPHGIEFSPDGSHIYVTNIEMNGIGVLPPFSDFNPDSARGELVQYDITLPTAEAIRASKQVIVPMSFTNRFGGMQLAPDGKIYIAQRELPFVSCIESPNERGAACGFTQRAVELLPGTRCGEGFPFVMANTLSKNLRVVPQDVCEGDTVDISLAGGFITDSVRWDFGDPTSPANNGFGRTGRHFYAKDGSYLATATMYIGSDAQKPVSAWVNVRPRPTATASASRMRVCDGDTVTLTAKGGIVTTWYLGTTLAPANLVGRANVLVTTAQPPGIYTAIVESVFGCLDTTTVTIDILTSPSVVLATDTSVCYGTTVTLTAQVTGQNIGAESITWLSTPPNPTLQSSGPTATFIATISGTYFVSAMAANGCERTKSINVRVLPLPKVVAEGDTTLCKPEPVPLTATGAQNYQWSDETGRSVGASATVVVTPRETTRYIVVGTDSNGCRNADTVTIILSPDIDLSIVGQRLSCDGEPITLTCIAPAEVNEVTITWLSEAGAVIARGKSISVMPTTRTLYRATVPGTGECIDTAEHEIKIGTRPQFTMWPADTTTCVGDTIVVQTSTGKRIVVPAQSGTQPISITEEDSVGCATTITSYVRGVTPDAITVAMRDTTVDIGNGTTTLTIDLISPPQLTGATIGAMQLRLTHRTRSYSVEMFSDARTGAALIPTATRVIGDSTEVDLSVPGATLTATRQPLVYMRGLPLVDDDSTSTIHAATLSIEGLALCIDTTSRDGKLTITGCGRKYFSGLHIGSALSVAAYPNPTSDVLTVAIDVGTLGIITLDLIDALGQQIITNTTTRTTTSRHTDTHIIDIHAIPTGTYRVVVSTPTEVITVGVVKR